MSAILEEKGYEDNGKIVVKCKKCKEALFTYWNVKDTNTYQEVSAKCPLCGGSSGAVDFFGINYIAIGNDGISDNFCSYDVEQVDDNKMQIILEKK